MRWVLKFDGRTVTVKSASRNKPPETASTKCFELCLTSFFRDFPDNKIDTGVIHKFFNTGKSFAIVFLMDFWRRGHSLKHRRLFKFDRLFTIEQEEKRFNTLAKGLEMIAPNEQLRKIPCEGTGEKALLPYHYAGVNADNLNDLVAYMAKLLTEKHRKTIKKDIFDVLDQVLMELFAHSYSERGALVASEDGYPFLGANEFSVNVFCNILPAVCVMNDSEPSNQNETVEVDALLLDVEETTGENESPLFKKKYVVERENGFFRIDLVTRKKPTQQEEDELLKHKPSDKQSCKIRINEDCQRRHLRDMIEKWVEESGLHLEPDKLRNILEKPINAPLSASRLHYDLNPANILVVKQKWFKRVKGVLIDYSTFNRGGHLYIDLARLEGLVLIEYALEAWRENLGDADILKQKTQRIEQALFYMDTRTEGLSEHDRDIVEIALHIRRIGLCRFREEKKHGSRLEGDRFRNYAMARFAFLISFQKIAKGDEFLIRKKRLALLFADELADLIEKEDIEDYAFANDKCRSRSSGTCKTVCKWAFIVFLNIAIGFFGAFISNEFSLVDLRSSPESLSKSDVVLMVEKNGFHHHKDLSPFGLCPVTAGQFENKFEFFETNGTLVATDRETGLMWQQSDFGDPIPFEPATEKIEKLNEMKYAGHKDWRMPTLEELASLISRKKIDRHFLDEGFSPVEKAWTRDLFTAESGKRENQYWIVLFHNGSVNFSRENEIANLIAVRNESDFGGRLWWFFFATAYVSGLATAIFHERWLAPSADRLCQLFRLD